MPRIKILSAIELKSFENPPEFNSVLRKKFFDLPKTFLGFAETLRTASNKIGFLLCCGYL